MLIKQHTKPWLFRALESQLERALAWRTSQTLDPKGVRDRGRSAAVPGGSTEGVDFGAARLCRELLEQCDLCADAVRMLGTAVSLAAKACTTASGRGASAAYLARAAEFGDTCFGIFNLFRRYFWSFSAPFTWWRNFLCRHTMCFRSQPVETVCSSVFSPP